jgi:muconolactone delta-isomerase
MYLVPQTRPTFGCNPATLPRPKARSRRGWTAAPSLHEDLVGLFEALCCVPGATDHRIARTLRLPRKFVRQQMVKVRAEETARAERLKAERIERSRRYGEWRALIGAAHSTEMRDTYLAAYDGYMEWLASFAGPGQGEFGKEGYVPATGAKADSPAAFTEWLGTLIVPEQRDPEVA